ncbi:DUF6199 family natural product biosynthesis protein [Paenibacillus sp. YN15]|uniref:DUF6199 family natural product biosynthesis protein n=1 Tax=Paenibacillus sp. YN15 TaxID=1742774 RepID=UPI000DCBB841|nr:DUF6199 family natural product biosynthesis protein [Paenibacillus sp. YN15]RAV06336.1 hypothetical protein DQG13_00355 [Paenibacillus sp. YN15]
MILFYFLFVALCVLNIINPRIGWYMRYGWAVKGNSEPSEGYLIMSRVSAVIVLVLFFIFIIR